MENLRETCEQILAEARSKNVLLRVIGGMAVCLHAPQAAVRPWLARSYGDLDFVTASPDDRILRSFFESIGYPALFAYLVILAEIVGGLMLIFGAYVRVVSLALLPVLIGATLEHLSSGWVFTASGGGWEFPVFWSVALVVQALLGPGAYATAVEPLPAQLRARMA